MMTTPAPLVTAIVRSTAAPLFIPVVLIPLLLQHPDLFPERFALPAAPPLPSDVRLPPLVPQLRDLILQLIQLVRALLALVIQLIDQCIRLLPLHIQL